MRQRPPRHPDHRIGRAVRRAAQNTARRGAGLRTRLARLSDLSLTYDEARPDAGQTVLMVHGFSADRDVWTRFATGLRRHHVVIPDLAGHGATPFLTGAGYSAPAQADRLIALLDRLGIERTHVIGNSMGGFIAATLAVRAPERVRSLALIDAAGVSSPQPSPLIKMLEGGRNPFLLDHAGQFDEFFAMTMARRPYVPRFVLRSIAADYLARRAALAEIFDDFAEHDQLDDHLDQITTPTWIAWGRHDQLIDVSSAHVWSGGLPNARLTIYEDLGHMPMLEAPARTRRDYLAFLDTLPAAGVAVPDDQLLDPARPTQNPRLSPA